MNKPAKVSVIMPSLNVQPYIGQCMESVLKQTLSDIEIICIDAGSTDGTLEILQQYAETDSRIRLLHADRKSYGYQVNLGIANASADYIGIVETDDYIDPTMYEKLYAAAMCKEKPDIVKSGYYTICFAGDGGEQIIPTLKIKEETGAVFNLHDHYELLLGHPSVWTCIYSKVFLDRNHIRMVEAPGAGWVDATFLYHTICEAERICWVNEPLYYYRRTNPNASIHLKDCSVPMARMNECKDYLEQFFPKNRVMEKNLLFRTMQCVDIMYKSPYCTDENRREAARTIKRFQPSIIVRIVLGRYYRRTRKALNVFLKSLKRE